jgi:hypothetical protein
MCEYRTALEMKLQNVGNQKLIQEKIEQIGQQKTLFSST